MRIFALQSYLWKTDKNSPLLVPGLATSKLSSHIQSCTPKITQETTEAQPSLCFDGPDTILFNSFMICLISLVPDSVSTFHIHLTVWTTYLCKENKKNVGFSPDLQIQTGDLCNHQTVYYYIWPCLHYQNPKLVVTGVEMNVPRSSSHVTLLSESTLLEKQEHRNAT